MTALADKRPRSTKSLKHVTLTLASGKIAYSGGRACLNPTTGKVEPASANPVLIPIGMFDEKVDASLAAKPVSVDLEREVWAEWFANSASTDLIAATDIGKDVFMVDDQTVGLTAGPSATGRAVAGRVWGVDSRLGVLVEKYTVRNDFAPTPAVGAYTANDLAPTSIISGATYDVPTTAAASTITLPVAAPDGTTCTFVADGTKNGHTVQYRDVTGTTVLTTALTASKRHLVMCAKRDGKWYANAYVSP
jgi:hypothetical protein